MTADGPNGGMGQEMNPAAGGDAFGGDATSGVDSLGKALRRNLSVERMAELWRRGRTVLRESGWQALWREIVFRFNLATHREVWRYRADIPLRRELKAQRAEAGGMADAPLVSVIVPLYNTPPGYLRQMAASVRRQSYLNWELVLADGSDPGHPASALAAGLTKRDERIKYLRLEKNLGISGNTNAGIAQCGGEWIVLLDHDDVLQLNALFEIARAALQKDANGQSPELIFSDEAVLDASLKKLGEFHFKGDYGPDTLRGCNTVTHLCAFTRGLLERAGGGERSEFDGAQDYDLVLRLTETAAKNDVNAIVHIPKVLYFWRQHGGSTAADINYKPEAVDAGRRAVQAQLDRLGLAGTVEAQQDHPGAMRVRYTIQGNSLVSVLIPSCDHADDLARCLQSLVTKGGWDNLDVLVIENNSKDPATEAYYKEAQKQYPNLRVVRYPGAFNYADINNFGAGLARGEYLLLLNNDVEITSEGFVRELLSYSQRPDVGAVGAKLAYPDDTVQHAGLIVGIGGTAGVSHKGHPMDNGGDLYRLATAQNVSAVTGAALMVKHSLYKAVGGLDAEHFAVAFNDVDLCLTLRKNGLWNVFTPFAVATHYESKSRGYDTEGPRKERFDREAAAYKEKWAALLAQGDPFYNPHFTLETENFAFR